MEQVQSQSFRVVGDVHGEIRPFSDSISSALASGRYVIQLGDLISHGTDGPACLRLAIDTMAENLGIFLRGNHEYGLVSCLTGKSGERSPKIARTVAQLNEFSGGADLIRRFLSVWEFVPWWVRHGSYVFVHGAFHISMSDHESPARIRDPHLRALAESLALYGEGPAPEGDSLSPRTYRWIETVPEGLTVVVGHDVRSKSKPVLISNATGGRVIFLDTGCGKGGRLSWLDLSGLGESFGSETKG